MVNDYKKIIFWTQHNKGTYKFTMVAIVCIDLFKLNLDKIPAWSGGQMNTLIHLYLKIHCYLVDLGERWSFL